jgi:hypothetical protein
MLDTTWSADRTRAWTHLEFLERHGYVLSEAERQELNQATGEEDAEVNRGNGTTLGHPRLNGPVRDLLGGASCCIGRHPTTCLLR